jgi:glycerate dehydrogenase
MQSTEPVMERIVFLERSTIPIDFRKPNFDHVWIEFGETAASEVVSRLREATIAIVNKLPLRESELSQLSRLKLIAVAATGVDNLDLSYCRDHGIAVCNTRGYAIHSLAEHVMMLILALRKNLIPYTMDMQHGEWEKAKQFCLLNYSIGDVYGSTLGVIGFGALGRSVTTLARNMGMHVLVAERKDALTIRDGRKAFEEVLQTSDVITLHCPLTEATTDLIGTRELDLMKPSAILINTARGGLVSETALLKALAEGKIAGAGIDVLRKEPPREGSRLLETSLPNLIVTPHVAWASRDAMRTLADQLVDNLEAFVRGEPENLVQ